MLVSQSHPNATRALRSLTTTYEAGKVPSANRVSVGMMRHCARHHFAHVGARDELELGGLASVHLVHQFPFREPIQIGHGTRLEEIDAAVLDAPLNIARPFPKLAYLSGACSPVMNSDVVDASDASRVGEKAARRARKKKARVSAIISELVRRMWESAINSPSSLSRPSRWQTRFQGSI